MKAEFDIDFSLALDSKTGRYFVCRDLIEDVSDLLREIRYWRYSAVAVPDGVLRKILVRGMDKEVSWRTKSALFDRFIPRLKSHRPVIFTDPLHVLLYRCKQTDLILCHDMGPVSHPKLYGPRVASLYMKVFSEIEAIRPHLVFVSRSSEREYARLYGTAFSSSCVIYPGMRTEIKPGTSAAVKAIRKPFLLTVGTIGVRKNQKRSVQAFRRSGLKDLDYQYVLTGPPAYGYQDVCDEIGLDDSVNITGYVSDDQLRWLYSNASGFVLPSLLEGFGIPAVEAVLNNLVPLVSKDSVLHEVTGDAAILVDPESVDSISRGMLELANLEGAGKQQRLAQLKLHVAQFSRSFAAQKWRHVLLNLGS